MKYLIVETNKLIQNIKTIKEFTNSEIIAVVKANGYGLGLLPFCALLLQQKISFFAVTELSDAIKIREAFGEVPKILYSGVIFNEEYADLIVKNDIIAMISSINCANLLEGACMDNSKVAQAHVKINTGMNRYGFSAFEQFSSIFNSERIVYTGAFTHLHSSMDKIKSFKQLEKFTSILKQCPKFDNIHACNSYATLNYKEFHLNTVRVGSAFLGRVCGSYSLHKIGYLQTVVAQVNNIKQFESVGYRQGFMASQDMGVAVLPVGTNDGFNIYKKDDLFSFSQVLRSMYHAFKNLGTSISVTVNDNQQAKVLGKIALNSTMIEDLGFIAGDIVKIDVNPLYINPEIERIYEPVN